MRISDWSSDVCSSDLVGEIIAVMMRHRKADRLARFIAAGEGALRILHRQRDVAADEMPARVAQQRAGQQPAPRQHLETVADAQHIRDPESVVAGKRVSVRVTLGGRRIIKKKKK